MKLTMNDTAKTVITEIESEVDRIGSWSEHLGYFTVVSVNGLDLLYNGQDHSKQSQKDFNKLIGKGFRKVYHPPYINEQEQAHWDAVAADCSNPELHGHTVRTTLAGEFSGCLVWDFHKQKCVPKEELTIV